MDEMATGNSKTKWNGNGTARLTHDVPAYSSSVNLTYEGKRAERDILSTQPADVKLPWQPEHEHERQNRLSGQMARLQCGHSSAALA